MCYLEFNFVQVQLPLAYVANDLIAVKPPQFFFFALLFKVRSDLIAIVKVDAHYQGVTVQVQLFVLASFCWQIVF
jgi:hypothetical protein